MRPILYLSASLLSLMLIASCSDDPLGGSGSLTSGVWVYDSTWTNGVVDLTPPDTLTFRSDLTGSYRSEIGWGSYDFTYTVRNDSLFRTRVAGQMPGVQDTCDYSRKNDQLELTFASGTVVQIRFLTRQSRWSPF